MAAPGDPQTPDDHDDLIGFTSPSSLSGTERQPPLAAPRPAEPEPDDYDDRDLFDDPPRRQPAPAQTAEAAVAATPVAPASRTANPSPSTGSDALQWGRDAAQSPRREPAPSKAAPLEGAMGLYAVYVLILCAVPTLGVSAVLGLLAVLTRRAPEQPLARSHAVFQKRTLIIAAIGAVLGVGLIMVNLGVFVLFALALWVLARGAAGALRLAAGRPFANPNTLLF